jgi:GT2 family glycosyltransferase
VSAAGGAARPRVLGIVLNYNGRDLTLATLESLLALAAPQLDLLVVDNGSTDGSDAAVAARFPGVRRVRTETNLGISGGLNLGFRIGLDEGYDYLMPMNNDIEVAPDLLAELLTAAERDPGLGCLGPKCYFFHGDRNRIWSAGGVLRLREAVTRERGMGELDRGQYDRDSEVDYVNGALMLVRREALLATGLWDPVYQVSVEDADWCTRMKRAGFRCGYVHRARLWHMVSPTTGGYVAGRTFRTGRSTAIYVRRHASLAGWASYLLWSLLALPAALLRELPRRNAGAVLAKCRGLVAGLTERLPPPPPPIAPRVS